MFKFLFGLIIVISILLFAIIPVEYGAFVGEFFIMMFRLMFWFFVIVIIGYVIYLVGWATIELIKFIFRAGR